MTDTMKLAALVLNHDPSALAKLVVALPAANDDSFDWQDELANDPAYEKWVNEMAMAEDFRNCRLPGE
jgi:hypothetical protein